MASSSTGRGDVPIIPAVLVGGLLVGGGWLWYESQPRPMAEIAPQPQSGPVMVRDFGSGEMLEVGTAPPSPPIRLGTAAPANAESPPADGQDAAAVETPPASSTDPVATPAEAPATGAGAAPDAGRWEEEIARYEATGAPAPGGVVLVGASNIRMWDTLAEDFPGLDVANRGVGGCKLSELADFAPRLLDPAKPAVIVVSAGSNDIHAGAEPEEVLEALHRLLATVRRGHPAVPLVVLAILPAKSRWDERAKQVKANDLMQAAIAALPAGGVPVEYLDVGPAFLGADGQPDPEAFLDDELHPSPLGNARRAAALRPVLERLLSAHAPGA